MGRDEILKQLTIIFKDVFDDDTLIISDSTTANDIADWDSLNHISLITSVEKRFNVKFEMKDVIGMKNVGEMTDIIKSQL